MTIPLTDAEAVDLLGADGAGLEDLCARADAVRRERAGDRLTFVVNRNLDTARVGGSPALVRDLVVEAAALGATEICVQGPLPADAPDDGYLELVRAVAGAAPGIHLHAFRPAEVADAAARLGVTPREFLDRARAAGLGSVPGTGARILDDAMRTPADLPVGRWVELITTAHAAGLTSTSTMVYGIGETPAQRVAHLRLLAGIAERTGGFTEFIAMPGSPAATPRDARAITAVARLLLAGRIDHIQAPWPKVGAEGALQLLRGGADDLGGLLLDGELDPSAGQEQGLSLTRADVDRIAAELGRPARQRTTRYGLL
ncbi:FO synthase [Actinoplanes sp. DH11]|uniref:FO synthase n=1 Tax=Actinoplanes sp. DH11 TaxID=2857011 RepID=UPI001E5149D6|nr:FO synthase [Actinoplanes sp. DH11]